MKEQNKNLQELLDRKKEAVVIQKEVKESYKPPYRPPAVRPANVSRPKRPVSSKKPQNERLKIKIKMFRVKILVCDFET